jgi:glycosyltransferase involved in cell wall biosynthesis
MTMSRTSPPANERRSIGGRVVEEGLTGAGFDLRSTPGVVLVETARPGRTAFDTVLAQNAWNVVPRHELRARLHDYPRAMRHRFRARRLITLVNFRRARRVVCLTDAMAEMCASRARSVTTAPVTVPLDVLAELPDGAGPEPDGTLLVPGTVAPYKAPAAALEFFEQHREAKGLERVLFAGGDDGSGCWQDVQDRARRLGVMCERRVLERAEMREAFTRASVVVVPSRMESLSFPLAEALVLAREVHASPIAAHREIAQRLGREPAWLGSEDGGDALTPLAASDVARLRGEWTHLGEALGLRRRMTDAGGA